VPSRRNDEEPACPHAGESRKGSPPMTRTVFRTCSLCEATCGLRFEVDGERVVSVRGDDDDVFSRGYVCPKGIAMGAVHNDPDRVRQPLMRDGNGGFRPASWDEALAHTASRLQAIRARYGADAIAVYIGNPVVHNLGAGLVRAGFLKAIGTRNCMSAGSQDTSPRFATSYYLYGSSLVAPVPDLDRTQYLLCIGANPHVSNGSVMTAPNMRERLRALRARGGRVVVVDPRRTETARAADEHVAIRPGSDALLLLAMVQVLVARGRVDRAAVARLASGWDAVEARLGSFTPAHVVAHTGIDAATIERLALEFADAPTAAAYSRIGVCNNAWGTVATYATDLLNLVGGRLGAIGGAMFPTPALDAAGLIRLLGDGHARWRSRVRGLPETLGDLPAAVLAEEIETPGPGQVRALVTYAGNPVLSTPNGRRLDAAIAGLEFRVAVDIYVNETTRHADVILPPAWSLAEPHADLVFSAFMVRNVARWSPAVVEPAPGERADWEILLDLAERLGGGPTGIGPVDHFWRVAGRFGLRWTPERMVALALRTGPYGDKLLPWRRGLDLDGLKAAPHGIDLGPLAPGVGRRVFHRDRKVHLAAPLLLDAVEALAVASAVPPDPEELLLIGRREVRTCNSWMHNVPALAAGRERCVLLVHPDDARRAGVTDGEVATLESRVHAGDVRVQVSDDMRPGVVSLPHGWGHAATAPWQRVASATPGVSANDWTDDGRVEGVVGQSILNGVPVRLQRRVAAAA